MEIRNCIIKFKCEMTWEELLETEQVNTRYCKDCDRGVHLDFHLMELRGLNNKERAEE